MSLSLIAHRVIYLSFHVRGDPYATVTRVDSARDPLDETPCNMSALLLSKKNRSERKSHWCCRRSQRVADHPRVTAAATAYRLMDQGNQEQNILVCVLGGWHFRCREGGRNMGGEDFDQRESKSEASACSRKDDS